MCSASLGYTTIIFRYLTEMLIAYGCLSKQIIHLGKQEMYSLIVLNVIQWLYANLHNAVYGKFL